MIDLGLLREKNYNCPILVGGVGEINFGHQYRQGNRIYSSNALAMCLLSQPVGNAGGWTYLYAVEVNDAICSNTESRKD